VERNVREVGTSYEWVECMNLVVSQFYIAQKSAAPEEK
jgi:hypothetical protein